ncbi:MULTISPECIES: sodium:solute symporter [unclassified Mycolicibacterium]|uniref:sodium:solute symporter n=1 Tax=unclassified Mycolicibacterium TaxID=2636767 RepID=UPI002ED8B60B
MEFAIIAIYVAGLVAVGVWAKTRISSQSDFLVAGRRLGPVLYMGTMSAICIGGASTVGGIGLGYEYGISGMWLVFFIGTGMLLMSLVFAGRINRLGIYTVSEMMELRYGGRAASVIAALVMFGYAFMVAVTSTIAYGAVFSVLFDIGRFPATLVGGGIVIVYSAVGGMWSITLTDFIQFIVKTIGIFAILLPAVLMKAGGWDGLHRALPDTAFSLTTIGGGTILSYFVVYFFGLVIGQDIWQRVFTARNETVARWSGAAAGVYCLLYAIAGALIGMGSRVFLPDITDRDLVFTHTVNQSLPLALAAIVVAAALSAIMSTSSGALIAAATVARKDLAALLLQALGRPVDDRSDTREIRQDRIYIVAVGASVIAAASAINDVVGALTIAYNLLVGALMVPIVGGLTTKWATGAAALSATTSGAVATLATMVYGGDIYASSPIFVGIAISAVTFIVTSRYSTPTDATIMASWQTRIARTRQSPAPDPTTTDPAPTDTNSCTPHTHVGGASPTDS